MVCKSFHYIFLQIILFGEIGSFGIIASKASKPEIAITRSIYKIISSNKVYSVSFVSVFPTAKNKPF